MTPQQFEHLILAYQRPLELFAAQWVASPEDCVQEAFVRLFGSRETVENPRAWLHRVVRRLAIDQQRSESSRKAREESFGKRLSKFRIAAGEFNAVDLNDALETLEPDEREVIVARIWGQLTLGEIAEMLDVATSTVHRRYQQAIQKLQPQFEVTCQTKNK